MKKIFIFLLVLSGINIRAQVTYDKVYAFGAYIRSSFLLPDSNIYGAGIFSNSRLYAIKQSATGELIWQKFYTVPFSNITDVHKIKLTPSGKLAILFDGGSNGCNMMFLDTAGNFFSGKSYLSPYFLGIDMDIDNAGNFYVASSDFSLAKIDSAGAVVWAKKYSNNMSTINSDDSPGSVVLSNGKLLLACVTEKELPMLNSYKCLALHTIDTAGNIINTKVLSDTTTIFYGLQECHAIPYGNGKVILSALYNWTAGFHEIIIKMDTSGQVDWTQRLYAGNGLINVRTFVHSDKSVYAAYCPSVSWDIGLSKLDSNGNFLWHKKYGSSTLFAHPSNVLSAAGNGIILTGQKHYLTGQPFISRMDSSGNWICPFYILNAGSGLPFFPAPDSTNTYSVTAFSVTTNSFIATDSGSTYQYTPCFTTGTEFPFTETAMKIFPSPATDELTISGYVNAGEITIYSPLGEKVFSQNLKANSQQQIDVSSLAPGIYVVKVLSGEKLFTQKVIKM